MEFISFALFLAFLAWWLNRYLNKKYPKNNNSINEPLPLPKTDYTAFYSKKRNIMTNNELKFYRLLKRDNFIDELFKQLDISLIRIPVQCYYDMQEIENKIKEKI